MIAPLKLDDVELEAIKDIVRLIRADARDAFLREVAQRLTGVEDRNVRGAAESVWRDIVRRRPEGVA